MKPAKLTPNILAHQAIENLFFETMFGRPDTDSALKTAGISRTELAMMDADDEISTACDTRREALIATPWHLEPCDSQACDFVWNQLEVHLNDITSCAWAANKYGYSVGEAVYERTNGRVGLAAFVEKPMEWFVPEITRQLFMRDPDSGLQVEVDTKVKFFQTVRNQTYKQPYGEALYSRLYSAWVYRTYGWRFWLQFVERRGTPFIFGKSGGDLEALSDALQNLIRGGSIALDKDEEIGLMDSANTGEAFAILDDRICRRIQKLILGQTGTTDVANSGSYAAAKVQDGVREDRRNADIRLTSPTVQRVVNALWILNRFGGDAPRFIREDDTGLQLERADRDLKLSQTGVKHTAQYFERVYDFEPGDIEVDDGAGTDQNDAQSDEQDGTATDAADAQDDAQDGENFAAQRFTRNQQAIEDIANAGIATGAQPVDPEIVRMAVMAAEDREDLEDRLATLLSDRPRSEFDRYLERSLFAADVMGYTHSKR